MQAGKTHRSDNGRVGEPKSRRELLKAAGVAAAAASVPWFYVSKAAAQSSGQGLFYQGKTIEIIVPFAPGGATDVGAQFLAPFMQRHIAGNPRVIIRHMPGGGSVLGANWFEANAKSDGLTILCTTSSTSFPYMLGQQGVNYNLGNKKVAMTQAFGPVIYASPQTGVQKPADLLRPRQRLIYGGIGATASDLPVLLAFELLKLDFQAVLGFTGRGPVRLAFERGETNLDFQFTQVYLTQVVPLVESGKAVPLMTGGAADANGNFVARDPVVSNLPSVYEVYQELHGQAPSGLEWEAYQAASLLTFEYGLTWWMPENTPPEALAALWDSVARINADPEFIEKGKSVTGGYPVQRGDRTEPVQKRALQPAPEVLNWLRNLLAGKYGVRF